MTDFTQATDPIALFNLWMNEATASEPNDPNAMTVATVDEDGMPNVRILLLKDVSNDGFVFYTNFESTKGQELLETPKAALCFYWKSLSRQVRVRGTTVPVSDAEANEYYASRPRGSRIGAWASQQSQPLENRETLEKAVEEFDRKYPGEDVPRPPHWSGYRLHPVEIEFWQAGEFRLHDRVRFAKSAGGWDKNRLYP